MMSIAELLVSRHSIRKFLELPIEDEKIELLKKAVILSPTGNQKNHWDFIFIRNKLMLNKLSKSKIHGSKLIAGAHLAVVIVGDPTISDTWIEDCSIASILLQLQALDLGLGSCWVQINKRQHNNSTSSEQFVKQLLEIPESKGVLSIIAIGYPAEKKAPISESKILYHKINDEKYSLQRIIFMSKKL
jgi:nitroreductase